MWSAASSPSGVLGIAPAEIEFGALLTLKSESGGNNFDHFPENKCGENAFTSIALAINNFRCPKI